MPFLRDDEFMLFMDCTMVNGKMITIDELKQLRDAGMQTAVWPETWWDKFIVDGRPNWGYFDAYLERMRQADMKCLIPLWAQQTRRVPSDWYIKTNSGYILGALSPWNAFAQARNRELLRLVIKQLTSDIVQFICGQHENNERVLLNRPAYYDNYALADWHKEHEGIPDHTTPEGAAWLKASYLRLMTDLMQLFVNTQHHEVWFALSWRKAQTPTISCHGCEWIEDYLAAWQAMNPVSINHISYNYFPYGQDYWDLIQAKDKLFKVKEFVGAEYCEGLRDGNGRLAVQQGLRGMIVGPTHGYTKHTQLESWMVDEIKETHLAFINRKDIPLRKNRLGERRMGIDIVSIGFSDGDSSGRETSFFLSWREMIQVATPSSTSMTAENTTVLRMDRARKSAGVSSWRGRSPSFFGSGSGF